MGKGLSCRIEAFTGFLRDSCKRLDMYITYKATDYYVKHGNRPEFRYNLLIRYSNTALGTYCAAKNTINIYLISLKQFVGCSIFDEVFSDVISHEYIHKLIQEHVSAKATTQFDNLKNTRNDGIGGTIEDGCNVLANLVVSSHKICTIESLNMESICLRYENISFELN